jgi:hypothetical protein
MRQAGLRELNRAKGPRTTVPGTGPDTRPDLVDRAFRAIGPLPPAEYESDHYRHQQPPATAAASVPSLHSTRRETHRDQGRDGGGAQSGARSGGEERTAHELLS